MNRTLKLNIFFCFMLLIGSCGSDGVQMIFSDKPSDLPAKKVVEQPVPEKVESVEPKKVVPVKPKLKISAKVEKYCKLVDTKFRKYGWGKSHCEKYNWHHVRNSYLGRPLIWKSWGEEVDVKNKNVTLIMCGVHGDEITPVKFCFDVIKSMENMVYDPESGFDLKDKLIVVAPIVTPDSFFKKYPTRTNYRGVDVNRNFPTRDWKQDALRLWKKRYRSDKRRYPGKRPLSEQETIFQVNLIKRYAPDKIVSVHAPLTILDYDGPEKHGHGKHFHAANQLLVQMSKDASGYRIKNYPFFPGSLGNYAGNELGIPTYTLELPTSDNRKHREYWKLFQKAIYSAINRDMSKLVNVADKEDKPKSGNKL
jgi:protein MpaA